jgi:CrcB protein
MTLLLVALGAAVGAPARYLVDRAVQARHRSSYPWGTWTVNVVASLILGVVTGAVVAGGAGEQVAALVGTGFCGALSTYSTFSFETLRLAETGRRGAAAGNVVLSVAAGLAAAAAGAGIAALLWA